MSNNVVPILIGVLVGCGVVAIIVYQLLRFLRGSIKLSMPGTAFASGGTIRGSFDLHTKKTIQGNKLIVTLIGVEVTRTRKDGKTQTHSHEVYRDEKLIEDAREYPAGHTSRHEFEIVAPNSSAPAFMSSPMGQTLSTALHVLSNRQTQLQWRIEARLDAKGVDLAAYKKISINMPRGL